MNIQFKASFAKDLHKIKNKNILEQVREIIEALEKDPEIKNIPNLKKLKSGDDCYRIRIGDYRIGLTIKNKMVVFVRCLNRKEIYQYFP